MSTLEQKYEYAGQPGRILPMLTGMFVGSLVGALTILLFAPQSGEKTRAELKEGVTAMRDRTTQTVKEKVTQVKSKSGQIKAEVLIKADELQHQGKDLLAKQLDRVSHAAEAGKHALQNS